MVIQNANGAPSAVNDFYETDEDTAFSIPSPGVLANDADPGGGPLQIVEIRMDPTLVGQTFTLGSGALLTLGADGGFTYDPNGSFERLDPGERIVDGAVYTVSNSAGETAFASLFVTIEGRLEREVGGPGDDVFFVPPAGEKLVQVYVGGPGFDTINFSRILGDLFISGSGRATGPGIEPLAFEAEGVVSGDGDDLFEVAVRGRQVVQDYDGGGGVDTVSFREVPGPVVVRGQGAAVDLAVPSAAPTSWSASLFAGPDRVFATVDLWRGLVVVDDERIRVSDVENIDGSAGDDRLKGDAKSNVILGNAGSDLIFGRGGGDEILAGDQDDIVFGGLGDDVIEGGSGLDILFGGWGRDRFRFAGGFEDDWVIGFRSGVDSLDFSSHDAVESLDDLSIRSARFGAVVRDETGGRLILFGVDAGSLMEDDFVFG